MTTSEKKTIRIQRKRDTQNKSEISRLEDIIKNLKKENNYLNKQLYKSKETIKKIHGEKLNSIKKIGEQFTYKLRAACALYKSIRIFFENNNFKLTRGGICGSLIRQLFELPFGLKDLFEDPSYGNPEAHDVDIILSKTFSMYEYEENIRIRNLLKLFCNDISRYLNLHSASPQTIPPLKIGDLIIVDVYETTLTSSSITSDDSIGRKKLKDIPHYIIKAIDNSHKVYTFDILGWIISERDHMWPHGDFDVNSLILTKNGIEPYDDTTFDFMETLERISSKEASCHIDLMNYQKFPDNMLRDEKIPFLKQIAFFFAHRTKILAYGYKKITSDFKVPKIIIENKEECFITACQPPYIKIELNCGHQISVMAYSGEIISGKKEYSESINCPLCREPLQIKFYDSKPTEIKPLTTHIPVLKKLYIEEENPYKKKIYSEDSQKYISELFGRKNNITENPTEIVHTVTITRHENRGTLGESS